MHLATCRRVGVAQIYASQSHLRWLTGLYDNKNTGCRQSSASCLNHMQRVVSTNIVQPHQALDCV